MANLEKIIKVTQEQYDILASGGKVGDYVGLQDEYIYMIEDTNEYITTAGGAIDGFLTITSKPDGAPLILHYNNDNDYFLRIYPNANDTTNIYEIDVSDNEAGNVSLSLPANSGTLALISDIPELQILITTGNEIDNNFSAFRTKLNSGKPIRLTDFWLHDGTIHFAGSIFYPPLSAPSNTLIGIFVSGIHQYTYTINNNNEIILELLLPQVKRYI